MRHNQRQVRVIATDTQNTGFWQPQVRIQALNADNATNAMGAAAWTATGSIYNSTMVDGANGRERVYSWQHVNGEGRVDRLYAWDSPTYWDTEIYGNQCDAPDTWGEYDDEQPFEYNNQTHAGGTCYGPPSDGAAGPSAN